VLTKIWSAQPENKEKNNKESLERTILLVQGNSDQSADGLMNRVDDYFREKKYQLSLVYSAEEATHQLAERSFPVIITSYEVGNFKETAFIKHLREKSPQSKIIVVTPENTAVGTVVRIMRDGAYDVIERPFALDDLDKRVGEIFSELYHAREKGEKLAPQLLPDACVVSKGVDCLKIIAGLTAAGKTRISKRVVRKLKEEKMPADYVRKTVTRKPREGEIAKEDLNFVGQLKFKALSNLRQFMIQYTYSGTDYGIPKSLGKSLDYGKGIVFLPITAHKGFKEVMAKYPYSSSIFLFTPIPELRERIRKRPLKSEQEKDREKTLEQEWPLWMKDLNLGERIRYVIDNSSAVANGESGDEVYYRIKGAVDKIYNIVQFELKHPSASMLTKLPKGAGPRALNELYLTGYVEDLFFRLFSKTTLEVRKMYEEGAEVTLEVGEPRNRKKVLYVNQAYGVLSVLFEPYMTPKASVFDERKTFLEAIIQRLGGERPKERKDESDFHTFSVYSPLRIEGLGINDALYFSLTDKEKLQRKKVLDPQQFSRFYNPDSPLTGLSFGFVSAAEKGRKVEVIPPYNIIE
jgi:guanylate kinase/FixJ family two-component response regulator